MIDWEVSGCAAKFLIMAKDSSGLGVFQKLWKFSGLSRKYFIRKKGWDRCKKIGTRNILQDSRLCKQFLGVFGLERFSTKALFPLCGELRAIYVCTIVHSLEEKKVHVRICRLECFMFWASFCSALVTQKYCATQKIRIHFSSLWFSCRYNLLVCVILARSPQSDRLCANLL